jgi:hypothetical protein
METGVGGVMITAEGVGLGGGVSVGSGKRTPVEVGDASSNWDRLCSTAERSRGTMVGVGAGPPVAQAVKVSNKRIMAIIRFIVSSIVLKQITNLNFLLVQLDLRGLTNERSTRWLQISICNP